MNATNKRYADKNPDKIKEWKSNQYQRVKADAIRYSDRLNKANKYRHKKIEHYRSKANELNKKRVDELHDGYIKNLITQRTDLSFSDIPEVLVRSKRLQIELHRKSKILNNEK